jgi:hypothetical protein
MIEKRSGRKGKRPEPSINQPETASESHFAFGGKKRSGSARRLFAPQKRLLSPIFETRTERPHAILRVISTSA